MKFIEVDGKTVVERRAPQGARGLKYLHSK